MFMSLIISFFWLILLVKCADLYSYRLWSQTCDQHLLLETLKQVKTTIHLIVNDHYLARVSY